MVSFLGSKLAAGASFFDFFKTKKNMGIPEDLPVGVSKRAYLTLAGISKAFKIDRLEKRLFDD